jgi:dienelactone hydrolase
MPEVTRELVEKEVARLEEADGKVVGVMGFSQGAKLAAGLLCNQQLLSSPSTAASPITTASKPASSFKFGVFLNGTSPPLFSLPSSTASATPDSAPTPSKQPLITVPSLHILGTEDPWKDSSRSLFADYFDPKTAELVELNCGHRLPTKEEDTKKIVDGILKLWNETKSDEV